VSKPGKYSNEERFDIEFKKRQNEIQSAISSWSQGEACREKVLQISSSLLKEHDELTNLSKRLFENGSFTEQFKGLTKLEIESIPRAGRFCEFGLSEAKHNRSLQSE
jgi:hypothetical protein